MLIGLPCHFQTMLRMLSILIAISASFSWIIGYDQWVYQKRYAGWHSGRHLKGTLGKAGAARGVDQALHLKLYITLRKPIPSSPTMSLSSLPRCRDRLRRC